MKLSHIEAEKRYGEIRDIAIQTAQQFIEAKDFTLSKITREALIETKKWQSSKIRKYNWDWLAEIQYYRSVYPKRFEVALWHNSNLVGISIGRPTFNATGMRLDVVEASPRDISDRPAVFDKIILAYEIYARMLGVSHIRIMHPVNSDVTRYYESFGYEYIANGDYLTKDIL